MTYTYDSCQRLKEECITDSNGTQLSKYTYGIGKAGERLSVTEINNGVETNIFFSYDKLERLVKETRERGNNKLVNEYTYDKVGNRLTKTTTISGNLSEIADINSDEVTITEGITTYTYNSLNQLVKETLPQGNIMYLYDYNGNLVSQSGVKNTEFIYDKENHLICTKTHNENKHNSREIYI